MPLFIFPVALKGFLLRHKTLLILFNLVCWFIFCYACFIVGFKAFENVSWIDADEVAWQTFTTVGYGNIIAATIGGKLITRIFGSWGIVFLGAIFTTIIEIVIENMQKRRFGLVKTKVKDGYIIVTWPGQAKFDLFIKNIRFKEPGVGIVIVDECLSELPSTVLMHGNVEFVKGTVTSWETFKKARIESNKKVHIFPKASNAASTDSTSSKIVELLEKNGDSDLKIIAYLVDIENEWMFQTQLPQTTILLEHMEVLAGVQEVQDDGTGKATQISILNSVGVDTQTKIPKLVIGQSWGDFQVAFSRLVKKTNTPVNLYGILGRDKQPEICPSQDRIIEPNDRILLFAHGNFNWSEFEAQLN